MSVEEPSRTVSAAQLRAAHPHRRLLVVRDGQCVEHSLPVSGTRVLGRGHAVDIVVDDRALSRRHLELRLGPTVQVTELGSHNGTRLRGRPLEPGVPIDLLDGDTLEAGTCSIIFRDEAAESPPASRAGQWLAAHAAAQRLAHTDLNVVVQGEPGTGKRTLATDLHAASGLTDALDVVDAKLLHADQLGALRHRSGPLLLLHVDSTPMALQGPLGKVLEGSSRRVLATAHSELSHRVATASFYVRLHRVLARAVVRLPPLRACRSELDDIIVSVLRRRATHLKLPGSPHVTPRAVKALRQRPWRGNIAELASCLDATLAGLDGPEIHPRDLVFPGETADVGSAEDIERQRIIEALEQCAGNQTKAAKLLKVSRRTLINRLDKYGLARPRKR